MRYIGLASEPGHGKMPYAKISQGIREVKLASLTSDLRQTNFSVYPNYKNLAAFYG